MPAVRMMEELVRDCGAARVIAFVDTDEEIVHLDGLLAQDGTIYCYGDKIEVRQWTSLHGLNQVVEELYRQVTYLVLMTTRVSPTAEHFTKSMDTLKAGETTAIVTTTFQGYQNVSGQQVTVELGSMYERYREHFLVFDIGAVSLYLCFDPRYINDNVDCVDALLGVYLALKVGGFYDVQVLDLQMPLEMPVAWDRESEEQQARIAFAQILGELERFYVRAPRVFDRVMQRANEFFGVFLEAPHD